MSLFGNTLEELRLISVLLLKDGSSFSIRSIAVAAFFLAML